MELSARSPAGPIENRWSDHRFHSKLVNPANRRKYRVIVVGSGLAGGAAAATFGEMGYNVSCFCYQDSPRRAHSIAAQGGINAAKNYQNDGDSTYRLFYDTVKGGDFRARDHPRELLFPFTGAQPGHAGDRASALQCLLDPIVRGAVRRDLREVCDAQHLALPRQFPQARPDDIGHRAADAGVDLVENERLAGRVGGRQRFERQHQPGELAA